MAHLYLPGVSTECNIPIPETVGHWRQVNRGVMQEIAKGILVDESAKASEVSSVPDVWARALLFQSALSDPNHPKRRSLLQEWRGLMSLLALHRLHSYNLEIVWVEPSRDRFFKALEELSPKPIRLQENLDYRWTDLLLIRCEGVPVGAFSPATLVFTAADYQEHPDWRSNTLNLKDENGRLCPPVLLDEIRYVGEWLSRLRKNLVEILWTAEENPCLREVGVINRLVREWLSDIRVQLGIGTNEDVESPEVEIDPEPAEISNTPHWLQVHRVYELLLHPLTKSAPRPEACHSDFALKPERNHSSYREIVLITRSLLGTRGKIWENRRVDHLGGSADEALPRFFNNPCGQTIDREDLSHCKALWVRPEHYFLSGTVIKGPGSAFLSESEAKANKGARYVLPFKPAILDFFSPDAILTLLRPDWKERDDGVEFVFYLPLQDGREERVVKRYKKQSTQPGEPRIKEIPVPLIEIFPNYLDQNWRRYYVSHTDTESICVDPVLFKQQMQSQSVRSQTVVISDSRHTLRICEISGDHAFPEGLLISTKEGRALTAAGLILLPASKEPDGLSKTWTVGIDFGTSNTNVYRQSGEKGAPEPWVLRFSKYARRVTECSDAERGVAKDELFIPSVDIRLPVPTNLQIFELSRKQNLLLDYGICFLEKYVLPKSVHTDIKWDAEEERKTEYFLEHLFFLLLIEIVRERVANVVFSYSYPKAFSPHHVGIFKEECRKVYDKLLQNRDTRVLAVWESANDTGRVKFEDLRFEREGIAAGEYFASERTITDWKQRAIKSIRALCVDAGGGTTDISTWYLDKIVADASILLAGRQVAELLQRNPRICELLFSSEAAASLEDHRREPRAFAACLNLVLKHEERRVHEMLLRHANQGDIQSLRRILAVEFGAIAFYCGMLLGVASRQAEGTGLAQELAKGGIDLHWGGNAAKFVNWIEHGRRLEPDGVATKILNAILYNSLKESLSGLLEESARISGQKLAQCQSPGHKNEVPAGLVVIFGDPKQKESGRSGSVHLPDHEEYEVNATEKGGPLCGELVETRGGGKIRFYESLQQRTLFPPDGTIFERTTLDRLARFVDILNSFGTRYGLFTDERKVNLSAADQAHIGDRVRGWFIQAQTIPEGKRLIEPVFIMEVRILLELLRHEAR